MLYNYGISIYASLCVLEQGWLKCDVVLTGTKDTQTQWYARYYVSRVFCCTESARFSKLVVLPRFCWGPPPELSFHERKIYFSWSGWTEAVQMGVLMQWHTSFVPKRCRARSKFSRSTRRISMLAATWAAALQLCHTLAAITKHPFLAPQQQVSSFGAGTG